MCGYSRMNFVMQCIYTLTINFIPNGYYCGFLPYNYTESYSVQKATYHTETRESLRLTFLLLKEEFGDTKGIIRNRKSKDRQHNGQKDKQRSTKHTHKDRITRTSIYTGVNSSAPEGQAVPVPLISYNCRQLQIQLPYDHHHDSPCHRYCDCTDVYHKPIIFRRKSYGVV